MVKSFTELGLDESILKVIQELKFTEPSEIQEKAIPLALAGKDVIGGSATGSGKTLAFGATILQHAEKGKGIQALIMTPTRELAEQVCNSLKNFGRYKHLKITPVYGGVSLLPQQEELETADIVVGTPGRILDHMSRETINFSKVKFLVLDEADRMLDMGFLEDVQQIIEACPTERQTFLFSATISHEIAKIAGKYMKSPVEVSVDSRVDPSKLEQVFYDAGNQKFSLLVHLLKNEESKLVMVFCNTKKNTDFIGRGLRAKGINALALHGDLSQSKRNRVLEQFNKSEKFVLVCTDVAARGLHIDNVSHVYNYDSPKTSTEYIHRIGRTARAGKEGKAISILGNYDYENFRRVLMDDSLNIQKQDLPQFEQIFISHSIGDRRPRGSYLGSSRGGYRSGGSGYRSSGSSGGYRSRSDGNRRPSRGYNSREGSRSDRPSYSREPTRKFSW